MIRSSPAYFRKGTSIRCLIRHDAIKVTSGHITSIQELHEASLGNKLEDTVAWTYTHSSLGVIFLGKFR